MTLGHWRTSRPARDNCSPEMEIPSEALPISLHGSLNICMLHPPSSTVRLYASMNADDPSFLIYFFDIGSAYSLHLILYLNGKDLRTLPLIERKAWLKKLLRRERSRILYLDHVEGRGRLLFEQIVAMDLEGIVCKQKDSKYKVTEK